jgi:RNA polymerase sigma factor (sigma-70 family)
MTPEAAYAQCKPMVFHIVGKFVRGIPSLRRHYDDLLQDGFVSLCSAARDYNPSRGKFSVHAYIRIERELRNTAARYVGQTRRPDRARDCGFRWREDESTPVEGELSEHESPARSPERAAILKDLVEQLPEVLDARRARLFERKLKTCVPYPTKDNPNRGGRGKGPRNAADTHDAIGVEFGMSGARVGQLLQDAGEDLRVWGEAIEREAA